MSGSSSSHDTFRGSIILVGLGEDDGSFWSTRFFIIGSDQPLVTGSWVGRSGSDEGTLLTFGEDLCSGFIAEEIKVESSWFSSLKHEVHDRHF